MSSTKTRTVGVKEKPKTSYQTTTIAAGVVQGNVYALKHYPIVGTFEVTLKLGAQRNWVTKEFCSPIACMAYAYCITNNMPITRSLVRDLAFLEKTDHPEENRDW